MEVGTRVRLLASGRTGNVAGPGPTRETPGAGGADAAKVLVQWDDPSYGSEFVAVSDLETI